jgi:hypothetical protein
VVAQQGHALLLGCDSLGIVNYCIETSGPLISPHLLSAGHDRQGTQRGFPKHIGQQADLGLGWDYACLM